MIKQYTLSVLFAFSLLISCENKENKTEPLYTVSGKITDSDGAGLSEVKIYHNSSDFVISDETGNWQIDDLSEPVTLKPEKEQYEFSPNQKLVSSAISNINFTAKSLIINYEEQVLNWFFNLQQDNGLLPSTEGGNMVSLYDNALAALVYIAYGDNTSAERIFDFFNGRIDSELKLDLGGFSQFRDRNGTPGNHRWMGDNAWLLMALNNYKTISNNNKYDRLITELNNWILELEDKINGGVWGGYDTDNNLIHKVTEGNIDAFNAIKGYTDFHSRLLNFLKAERWDATDRNLIATSDNERYRYAMDIHPWSYCVFENYPVSSLTSADRYLTSKFATSSNAYITGYSFDIDRDAVWLEGTGEMVVAFQEAGMDSEADFYIVEMEKTMIKSSLFENSMALPYAANQGTGYGNGNLWDGVDTNPAISSSAWYLLGKKRFNPFAIEKNKNIPDNDKFWVH